VVPFSFREPLLNQLNLPCWCSDAFRGLLLKHVQNIDGILKAHGINGPPRIPVVRSYNFEHAGATKAFERFGRGIDSALLGHEECMSNVDPDLGRKGT
jgi:hypothetical protein